MNFKTIRELNLKYWLSETKRKRYVNDITYNSFECKWQNKYCKNDLHNSFFCSVAEWNTHITDLLRDTSFDSYNFNQIKYTKALFRHYTRILLIVSKIMTDFQDFLIYFENIHQSRARTKLTDVNLSFTLRELFNYINAICKHKIGQNKFNKYHYYNHHIKYYFKDSGLKKPSTLINIPNVSSIKVVGNEQLEIPLLKDILAQLIYSYKVLDISLKNNFKTRKNLLIIFER